MIPLSEKSSYLNPDVSMSETEMVKFCWTVWNSKANYHDVRTKKDKMLFKLNNIYTIDDYFFMDIELVNQTKIKYDIDQVRFKIEDKKQNKRTTTQSVEVEPVMSLFDIKEFKKTTAMSMCSRNSHSLTRRSSPLNLPNSSTLEEPFS